MQHPVAIVPLNDSTCLDAGRLVGCLLDRHPGLSSFDCSQQIGTLGGPSAKDRCEDYEMALGELSRRLLTPALFLAAALRDYWRHVAAILVGSALAAAPVAAAQGPPILEAQIIRTFDVAPFIVMCYAQTPKFVYAVNRKTGTTIEEMSFDGARKTLAEFPRPLNESSLSCSSDGSTIAVMDISSSLYFIKDGALSEYHFGGAVLPAFAPNGILSEDGKTIVLPETAIHVSGEDILRDMRPLIVHEGSTFVLSGKVYVYRREHPSFVEVQQYRDGAWKAKSIRLPVSVNFVASVTACGGHDIATLTKYDGYLYFDLTNGRATQNDWLKDIGFRTQLQFRRFGEAQGHSGSFGHCAVIASKEQVIPSELTAIFAFDEGGFRIYRVGPQLVASHTEIQLTKDGCRALFHASSSEPHSPAGRAVHLVGLPSARCNSDDK